MSRKSRIDVGVDVVVNSSQRYRGNIEGLSSNISIIDQDELRYWLMSFCTFLLGTNEKVLTDPSMFLRLVRQELSRVSLPLLTISVRKQ